MYEGRFIANPEYTDNAFMLNVTIRNGKINGELNPALLYLNKSELAVYHLIEEALQNSRQEIAVRLNISTRTVDRAIKTLIKKDLIVREESKNRILENNNLKICTVDLTEKDGAFMYVADWLLNKYSLPKNAKMIIMSIGILIKISLVFYRKTNLFVTVGG